MREGGAKDAARSPRTTNLRTKSAAARCKKTRENAGDPPKKLRMHRKRKGVERIGRSKTNSTDEKGRRTLKNAAPRPGTNKMKDQTPRPESLKPNGRRAALTGRLPGGEAYR